MEHPVIKAPNRAKVTVATSAVALQTGAWKYPADKNGIDIAFWVDLPDLSYVQFYQRLLCNNVKEC